MDSINFTADEKKRLKEVTSQLKLSVTDINILIGNPTMTRLRMIDETLEFCIKAVFNIRTRFHYDGTRLLPDVVNGDANSPSVQPI